MSDIYVITPHTRQRAKALGVSVKPSTKPDKKIDVIRNGDVIASVGGKGYKDYGIYLATEGKKVADMKRASYKSRHAKDMRVKDSPGYWANALLW